MRAFWRLDSLFCADVDLESAISFTLTNRDHGLRRSISIFFPVSIRGSRSGLGRWEATSLFMEVDISMVVLRTTIPVVLSMVRLSIVVVFFVSISDPWRRTAAERFEAVTIPAFRCPWRGICVVSRHGR